VVDHDLPQGPDTAVVVVTVSGADGHAPASRGGALDPLRSLRSWLVGEDELRGRVRLVVPAPGPGELGALAEALQVVLAPGGAVAALAAALVSWARRQRTDLRVTLRRGDGLLAEVEVKRLRGLDAANLPATIEALRRCLDAATPGADGMPAPAVDPAPVAGATGTAGGDDAAAGSR
jgi:hypothetical protein